MKNPYYPGISGGIEDVTGELIVDTGLMEVFAISATLLTAVAANEESDVAIELQDAVAGTTRKAKILVTKGGTNHATAGDSAVSVSWMAIGR